ncbi:MAG: septal ring lytic transglycosylase RlpA family protein [Euryarchaeota archaeon]|nr:septal ring lytic transglycosylase RlpA family protein [Euryarchaeota archaeon]
MVRKISLILIMSGLFFLTGCSHRGPYATSYTSKARHKATMKTYRVRGRTYRPTYVRVGDTMRGVSSWYGPNFHGKYTSNGEIYNMHKMTAAHKTWPMDTIVRVENLDNGKSVVVRINDRGPFVRGRVIDCSYAAGKKLGLDRTGIARVKLTVLGFSGKVFKPRVGKVQAKHVSKLQQVPAVRLSDFGVQVGAFYQYKGALQYKRRFAKIAGKKQRVEIRRFNEDGRLLYRVWVMGFDTADEAKDFIRDYGISGGFLIRP